MTLPPFPDEYIPTSPEARLRLIAWGEECARMGAEGASGGCGEIELLEALQEIARWSGNTRVKWYVDQYAIKLIAICAAIDAARGADKGSGE